MATSKEHKQWARKNERVYQRLGGSAAGADERPWAYTILFYAAVHDIQSVIVRDRNWLSSKGYGVPIGHMDRLEILRQFYGRVAPMYASSKI
jgi:hypothetical protein